MFFKSIIGALAVVLFSGPWNGVAQAGTDDGPASSKLIIKPAVLTTSDQQASAPITQVQYRRYRPYYRGGYYRGGSRYGYPYAYSYSRPYYRSYYRPYYGGYYASYRPYYRGYYAPYYTGYRGFSYYGPRVGASFYW